MQKSTTKARTHLIKKSIKLAPEHVLCNYSHRVCTQPRLDGYDFCRRHILEDKNAPYKQCNYVSNKNGKRCVLPAPKSERKEGLCMAHGKKAGVFRQRNSRKRRPRETAETLLEELEHYSMTKEGSTSTEAKKIRSSLDLVTHRILEYDSLSESEDDNPLVDQVWRGDGDSDGESIDSEHEDYLKRAGVYTAEEVATILRDKLIRLQSLYIEQFKHLQHELKEKRRKYLHDKRHEMQRGGQQGYKNDSKNQDSLVMMNAMKSYHTRHSKEALLHSQSKERRMAASDPINYRTPPPHVTKCTKSEMGVKCNSPAVPFTKFCHKHILNDPHQVLYQQCNFGDGACQTACAPIDTDNLHCLLHVQLSQVTPLLIKQRESNQEKEHHVDVVSDDVTHDDVVSDDVVSHDDISMSAAPPSDELTVTDDTTMTLPLKHVPEVM